MAPLMLGLIGCIRSSTNTLSEAFSLSGAGTAVIALSVLQ